MEQEVYAIALQWLRDEESNQTEFWCAIAGASYDNAGICDGCPYFTDRG